MFITTLYTHRVFRVVGLVPAADAPAADDAPAVFAVGDRVMYTRVRDGAKEETMATVSSRTHASHSRHARVVVCVRLQQSDAGVTR